MNIDCCNFSVLSEIRKNNRDIGMNIIEMITEVLESSNLKEKKIILKIKRKIKRLREIQKKIVQCDDSIHVLLEDEDLINDIEDSSSIYLHIEKIVAEAKFMLEHRFCQAVETKFNGQISEWFRFWGYFEKEINSRKDLSSRFKLVCLKHRLEGWPLNMISELGTGDSVYEDALKLLQSKFDNKSLLIEAHLNALLDLESPTATPVSLMKFSSDFEYHIMALEAYETDIEEAGFFVVAILNKKLPQKILERMNKYDKKDYWTYTEFQNALNIEIESLYLELAPKSNLSSSCNKNKNLKNSAISTTFCQLCRGKHKALHCNIFKSKGMKVAKALNLNLCLICLGNNHISEECVNSPQCEVCGGKHNSIYCSTSKESKKKSKRERLETENYEISCQLCKGNHEGLECDVYNSKIKRMERALELNLCLMCLGSNHTSEKCTKISACNFCGAKHNSLMCIKKCNEKERKGDETKKEIIEVICRLCKGNHESQNCQVYNSKDSTIGTILCQLCRGKHQAEDCTIFNTNGLKMEIALKRNLCLICFDSNHISEKCVHFPPCKVCGGKHNSIFCYNSKNNNNRNIDRLVTENYETRCQLCKGNHDSLGCDVYDSKTKRMERALELNLCLMCLDSDHTSEKCTKISACNFCGAKHNSLMCIKKCNEKERKRDETKKIIEVICQLCKGNHENQKCKVYDSKDSVIGTIPCQLCRGKHQAEDCNIFNTKDLKMERALKLNLCLICFDNNHVSEECVNFPQCKVCGGKHNSLHCYKPKETMREGLENGNYEIICQLCKGNHESQMCKVYNSKDSTIGTILCQLCKGKHEAADCNIFNTNGLKMERALKLNLCLICFDSNHVSEECVNFIQCKDCGGKHNSLLCYRPKKRMREGLESTNNEIICQFCKGNHDSQKCEVDNSKNSTIGTLCQLCRGKHQAVDCNIFNSKDKRLERALKLNLCVKCFASNHVSEECVNCTQHEVCDAKHSSQLCYKPKKRMKEELENENNELICLLCKRNHGSQKCKVYNSKDSTIGTILCQLCRGKHQAVDCNIFNSKDKRLERALKLNLCVKCFDSNHVSEECVNCTQHEICDAKHSSQLCYKPKKRMKEGLENENNELICLLCKGNHESQKCKAGNSKDSTIGTVLCQLCRGKHQAVDCNIFNSKDKRLERALKLNLCVKCFDSNHVSEECVNFTQHEVCDAKHSSRLCYKPKKRMKEGLENENNELICLLCKGNHESQKCKVYNSKDSTIGTILCQLCRGKHQAVDCNIFNSKDKRLERALKLNLCVKCFDSNHVSEECVHFSQHEVCDAKHNSRLCYKPKKRRKEGLENENNEMICQLCKGNHESQKCKVYNSKDSTIGTIVCQLCRGKHQVVDCNNFNTKGSKMERALNLNLCLICFDSNHVSEECANFSRCKVCRGLHNSLFCYNPRKRMREV